MVTCANPEAIWEGAVGLDPPWKITSGYRFP